MTALSDRLIVQRAAGRAIEVWAQTMIEDLAVGGLGTFIGTVVANRQVELLQEPATNWEDQPNFGVAVGPVGVPLKEVKLKAHDANLNVFTALWWREDQQDRQPTEAGVEDLEGHYIELIHSNPQLVWKGDWVANPPAGSAIVKAGPGQVTKIPEILPSAYERFVEDGECRFLAFFVTAYTIQEQL